MSRSVSILIVVIGGLGYFVLTVWTIRRLWRPTDTPYARIVYRSGVRFFGVGWWLLFSFFSSLRERGGLLAVLQATAVMLVLTLPLALWCGYWWGRSMAWYYKVSDGR